MNPKDLSIKEFSYELPDKRIAVYPLAKRDASKLLTYRNGVITQDTYAHLAAHIPEQSLLVFNDTKVIEARILFQKPTGGVVEVFCLSPDSTYTDITTAMGQQRYVLWKCLVGGASKWKRGQTLEKKIHHGDQEITLYADYLEKLPDAFLIKLAWSPETMTFSEIIHLAGAIPLPPYIKRQPNADDNERYQTTYARFPGSVAAPTAGLHFTESIFEDFERKSIAVDFVTLHVGAGTFKPVKTETIGEHEMHAEFIDVRVSTVKNILTSLEKTIVAVGTTSLRALETLYWLGVKVHSTIGEASATEQVLELDQWEAYDTLSDNVAPHDSLQALVNWMEKNNIDRIIASTKMIIAPGYRTRLAKGLITNFHQPGSTLLLLVAALVGPQWKQIYQYALENDFRFLSYGDGSLIWINS